MQAFITYDINHGHNEVKERMIARGYYSAWMSNSITYYLPNTSLWKNETELATARKDLEETINILNQTPKFTQSMIKLERCIVVGASPWDGIPGTPIGSVI
jgi:hypothetical protein